MAEITEPTNRETTDRVASTNRTSVLWRVFGHRAPKAEVVFVCQMLIIFIVVVSSIYNLTVGHSASNLWTALLSSCLGYVLPAPALSQKQT